VCARSPQCSLRPLAERLSAHDGRVEGLTVMGGVVFTAGFDGSLKMCESPSSPPRPIPGGAPPAAF
jgi:hypothetical protein